MAINANLGWSNANSYVSEADADTYAGTVWWGSSWLALSAENKKIALIGSTAALETLTWKGTRCSPSADNPDKPQALSWPRSDSACDGVAATCDLLPHAIVAATCELAYQLSTNPGAITGDGATSNQGPIKKQQLGSLSQEFFEPGGNDSKVSGQAPLVLQKFPFLVDVLGCWLESTSTTSRVILRVRS